MNIAVKGVHVKENKALEDFAMRKAEKFYRHNPEITKVEIELKSETSHKKKEDDFIADITLHIPGKTLKIADQERDLYVAVDHAVNRMNEILRREKGKEDGRFRHRLGRAVRRGLNIFPEALQRVNKNLFRRG